MGSSAPMNVGVIATVPWRARALQIALNSIAAQSHQLDAVLVVGEGGVETAPICERLISVVPCPDRVNAVAFDTISGGAWRRLQAARDGYGCHVGRFVIFDDDTNYPPDHVARLLDWAEKLGGPVAFGGVAIDGIIHAFNGGGVEKPTRALQLQLGVAAVPAAALVGIEHDKIAGPMIEPGAGLEPALGYWWWKNGIQAWLAPCTDPAGPIGGEGGAFDRRSLYRVAGDDRRERAWLRLAKQTGWPYIAMNV